MGRITLILICVLASGCAAVPASKSVSTGPTSQYTESAASALAFDPPIAAGALHPELARGPRAPAAFFGYQESTTEYFSSATDDLQNSAWGDFYTKESISVKSAVRYR